jgi:hypothetical protein
MAYQSGHIEEARAAWNALLQLPIKQRLWRATWAAFMLGKSYQSESPDDAVAWFKRVRETKVEGCADSLGLAASSFGWQAKIELQRGNYAGAIDLYLIQMASGDPTAPFSLRDVAAIVFKRNDANVLSSLAMNSAARKVLTSFLVAKGGASPGRPYDPESPQLIAWLNANEQAKITNVDDADRLAWAAYQAGDFNRTQRWLERADAKSSITMWIQAKLLLRAGKTQQGAEVLSKVCRSFPNDEKWDADLLNGSDGDYEDGYKPASRALGELGSVQFARHNYTQALDCLLRAGYWADSAYVAERVMTANELKSYVDNTWPESTPAGKGGEEDGRFGVWHAGNGKCLRHLLARRLTRLGRWREARTYFPTELRPQLDAYIASIRAGHNLKLSVEERAQALWTAAKIARNYGMELLATELGPDGAENGGAFEGASAAENVRPMKGVPATLFPVDNDLHRRLDENVVTPYKRFHYRYIAAEHAWAAIELMPNENVETAQVLCTAGSWLKDRDPKAADRFYKALVRRCGTTALGREAAHTKWFPKGESAELVAPAAK